MSTAVISHENITNQAEVLQGGFRSSLFAEATSQVQMHEEQRYEAEHGCYKSYGIVGQSRALKDAMRSAEMVAPTDSTVLILGETGTGKELVARALHELGRRRTRTFVKVNCAAIPSGLLESELFGHEKGAFTGALNRKIGRFDLANEGTLFLDEVGDIPLELQPKLLRVLQEQEFERLGSVQTIRVNVRLVAATSRDLSQMVEEGKFRSDLYYRLNVFPVAMPPLRERRDDIPQLVRHFLDIFSKRMGKRIERISQTTMDSFSAYHWPGNVRELQNLVERAVIRSDNGVLPNPISSSEASRLDVAPAGPHGTATSTDDLPEVILTDRECRELERANLMKALQRADGRIYGEGGAAALLGINPTTLASRLRALKIRPRCVDRTASASTSSIPPKVTDTSAASGPDEDRV